MPIRVALTPMESNETANAAGRWDCAIVVTRPERSAERFASLLSAKGSKRFDILVSPLLTIVPVVHEADLSDFAAVVLTSENAVRFTAPGGASPRMPAYCIGEATAAAAAAAGFLPVVAGNSSESLVSLAAREHSGGKLLHLRGRHAAGDIAGRLSDAGLPSEEVVVYDQVRTRLSSAARQALTLKRCVFPVFSPRTAGILADEAAFAPHLGHAVCCMSANVAEAFRLNWRCIVASAPTLRAMLSATLELAAEPAARSESG